jgi:hypothetical protein
VAAGGGGGLGTQGAQPTTQGRYVQCLKNDPGLPYIAPFSLTGMLNIKVPSEWWNGTSRWASLDRRLPSWLGADTQRGAQVIRGRVGRVKWLGRYGTIAAAVTGFSTAYSITAMARCYDESQ